MVWYAFNPILLGVILLAVTILCLRFKDMAKLTKPLAVFLAVAVAFSLGQAVFYSTKVSAIPPVALVDNSENNPNIYFIIPDRFPSIAAMQETGIDTTEFTTQLRADGFYINPNQISHDLFTPNTKDATTTRTMRYLAAVLNMGETVTLTTPYKTVLQMIKDPSIIPIAHLLGYEYINIGSWFTETAVSPNADYNYIYEGGSLADKIYRDEFSVAVWDRSLLHGFSLRRLLGASTINDLEMRRELYQTQTIQSVARQDGPRLVFMHLIMPHPPYVWDADGNPQTDTTLSEPELYRQQIIYAQQFLIEMERGIVANDPTAIILFQSDEGMAYQKPLALNLALSPTQWNGVLSAWRIPGMHVSDMENVLHTDVLKLVMNWVRSK